MKMPGIAPCLLLTTLVIQSVDGWAPFVHIVGYGRAMGEDTPTGELSISDALNAVELPDAFYFSGFIDSSKCPKDKPLRSLHNAEFAGYMLQQAVQSRNDSLVEFAQLYGSHMQVDAVGFNPQGFLGNFDGNWIAMWQQMTSLDTVAFNLPDLGDSFYIAGQDLRDSAKLSRSLAEFFADCTDGYVEEYGPNIPVLTTDEVVHCSFAWVKQIAASFQRSQATSQSTQEDELRLWSPFQGNYTEQLDILDRQADCSGNVTQFWWTAVGQMSPERAAASATARVSQLYDSGECT